MAANAYLMSQVPVSSQVKRRGDWEELCPLVDVVLLDTDMEGLIFGNEAFQIANRFYLWNAKAEGDHLGQLHGMAIDINWYGEQPLNEFMNVILWMARP